MAEDNTNNQTPQNNQQQSPLQQAENINQQKSPSQQRNQQPTNDGIKKAEEFMEKLTEKENSLKERENQLDKKFDDFKTAQEEAMKQGFSRMTPEKSEDEKNIEAADKLMAGTGMSFVETVPDPFTQKKK